MLLIKFPPSSADALESWPALQKWTNKFLDRQFGKNDVRVAFAPNGDYEGCEKASSFEDYINFNPPEVVKNQLPFSDLVVVRPAFRNMNFSSFMEIVERPSPNVSAYLEYSSIPSLLPELVKDVNEMPFVLDTMQLQHLNIWLSDGNTLGKLHFDPFDNFLCQVRFNIMFCWFALHFDSVCTCLYLVFGLIPTIRGKDGARYWIPPLVTNVMNGRRNYLPTKNKKNYHIQCYGDLWWGLGNHMRRCKEYSLTIVVLQY